MILTSKFVLKENKGFTLIELLVSVAIIAVLASISLSQLRSYRSKAYNAAAAADTKNAMTIISTNI